MSGRVVPFPTRRPPAEEPVVVKVMRGDRVLFESSSSSENITLDAEGPDLVQAMHETSRAGSMLFQLLKEDER